MRNKLILLSAIGFLLLLTPYFVWYILGEDSFILIHDNLDSEFVYILKLLNEGDLFSYKDEIPGIMNGLPRYLFRSPLNFTFVLFSILRPVYAYITNHLLVHIIGYLGMVFLLKRYFIKQKDWLVVSVSFCFGFLSYYHVQYGISISGQPILLFAFLNLLYKQQKWYDYIIIILFPFYSFLIVTLPFFIPLLIILGIYYYKKNKVLPGNYIGAIIALCCINLLVEFPLVYATFFNSDFVSHRVDWNRFYAGAPTIKEAYSILLDSFKTTHYHSGTFNPLPIIFATVAVMFRLQKRVLHVIYILVFILIWVALNSVLVFPLYDKINIFKTFNTERFYFLLPFLWLLLLGLVLNELDYSKHLSKVFAVLILFFCIKGIYLGNTEYKFNYSILTKNELRWPTFKKFYDVALFDDVKEYIGQENINNYSFVCIGIFPSVLQFNGLKTLDSYQNNYKLLYKKEFRKIIEKELDRSVLLKNYFDHWGSRCYTFSSEIERNYLLSKQSAYKIKNSTLNTDQMFQMGGKYLLSAIPIQNCSEIKMTFLSSFETNESYWKLYLYEYTE